MRYFKHSEKARGLAPPIIDHPEIGKVVAVPPAFGGGFRDCPPGAAAFGLVDAGYFIVPVGGVIEVPDWVEPAILKAIAPCMEPMPGDYVPPVEMIAEPESVS